ncbi:MAG: DNA/RNA nuclease SfsA [Planctomycetes bacterium]|nr:DNA/RNA nuclease SfsA [Planctomycetota bacterium]
MAAAPRHRRATLLRRYKRFLADVELDDGEVLTVHCPNPGRMIGVQPAGAEVCLRDSRDPRRKLRWTLQSVRVGATWVNLDTHLANPFVEACVRAGALPELAGYASLRREVRYGASSRIDLLLEDPARPPCYVEVKSTTLLEGDTAKFPDAVTARGLKHLRELSAVAAEGARAVLVFLVGRDDAARFAPADAIDPAYGAGLRAALDAGVEALCYAARGGPEELALAGRLELVLPPLGAEAAR